MAGESGGGNKPIIKVEMDVSSFDSFIDAYQAWSKKVESMPDTLKASSKGTAEIAKSWANVEKSFDGMVKAATADKFSSPTSGTFVRIRKDAEQTSKFWLNTRREIERSDKALQSMVRGGLSLSKVFGVFGSAGLLAGGIFGGTLAASNSVAADYKSSRQLGLELGKEKEFGIAGTPYGLGRDQLDEAANAKSDPTKQLAFMNAGISPADIASLDAAELAWRKAEGEARLFSQWQKTSPQFAVAQAQSFFPGENPDQLRLLADALDKGDLQRAHDTYEANWKSVGYSQQQGEAATQFAQDQAQKWAAIEAAFNKDVLLLAPYLDRWATAAENLVVGFLDKTAKTVDDLANAGDHPTPPGTPIPHAAANDYPGRIREAEQIAGQWLQAHGVKNPFDDAATTAARSGSREDQILAAIQHNEDPSVDPNAVNPKTGAAGLMQITPANYKRAGIDPFDPAQNRALGKQIFDEFLTKYHGDTAKAAAAYDGFKNLDADIAKYGDSWRDHINEFQKGTETTDYLNRLEKQGIVLGNMDAQTAKTNARDDFPIVPYVEGSNPDADINAPQYRNISGLNDVAANLKALWHSTVGEGAGARYRHDDTYLQKRIDRQGGPSVINSTVTVNAPPGHDVNVSTTQLAQ